MNPFENPTFARTLTDFALDHQRTFIPSQNSVLNLPGDGIIGRESGTVVTLSRGLQALELHHGGLVKVTLFGSDANSRYGALLHMSYHHGNERELQTNAIVASETLCPGIYFDLDCGCRGSTDETLREMYTKEPDAAAYISLNAFTPPQSRLERAIDMYEALGIRHASRDVTQKNILLNCRTYDMLTQHDEVLGTFQSSDGQLFLKTHDEHTSFRGGKPVRMIVYEEPRREDKKGYGGNVRRHFVFVYGDITKTTPVVRYHSSCITAELGGNGCDCRMQREEFMNIAMQRGAGVFLYADEEGMRLGLTAKLFQTTLSLGGGVDLLQAREYYLNIPGDIRRYDLIDAVRQDIGLTEALIASNNKSKRRQFERNGVRIVGQFPMKIDVTCLAVQAARDAAAKVRSGNYLDYCPTTGR